MQSIKKFLEPDRRKLILYAVFVAIAVGGKIQAWGFSDVPAEPPLYDLLRPFPFWPAWMTLLMPFALLALPLRIIGLDILQAPTWLFSLSNLLYFYCLACFVFATLDGRDIGRKQSMRGFSRILKALRIRSQCRKVIRRD